MAWRRSDCPSAGPCLRDRRPSLGSSLPPDRRAAGTIDVPPEMEPHYQPRITVDYFLRAALPAPLGSAITYTVGGLRLVECFIPAPSAFCLPTSSIRLPPFAFRRRFPSAGC